MDLIEHLFEKSYVTKVIVGLLRSFQQQWQCSSYEAVIQANLYTQSELANIIANSTQLSRVYKLSDMSFSSEVIAAMPFKIASEHNCMPVEIAADKKTLSVAFADPYCEEFLAKLQSETSYKIKPVIAERCEIYAAIRHHYSIAEQMG